MDMLILLLEWAIVLFPIYLFTMALRDEFARVRVRNLRIEEDERRQEKVKKYLEERDND